MYEHERSLVSKYKNQPFVLLGVNSDAVNTAKAAVKREKLNWRSWSGGKGGGPIAKAWEISGWPSMFVIDAEGIIRYQIRGADKDKLDKAIEDLMRKANRGESGLAN